VIAVTSTANVLQAHRTAQYGEMRR
jgi:hypothetical protein